MITCSRKYCGEEAIGTTPNGDPLCLDHMGEWLSERDGAEAEEFSDEHPFLRLARAM